MSFVFSKNKGSINLCRSTAHQNMTFSCTGNSHGDFRNTNICYFDCLYSYFLWIMSHPKKIHAFVFYFAQSWTCRLRFFFTRWFKYDRDWFVCKQAALRSSCAVRLVYIQISPGHIWTTLYMQLGKWSLQDPALVECYWIVEWDIKKIIGQK